MTPIQARPFSRRGFLAGAGACALAAAMPRVLRAETATTRGITMTHQRNGETFAEIYYDAGEYLSGALERFASFARDIHSGATHEMDPRLLDLIFLIQQELGRDTPVVLTNGFRAPATNRRIAGASANSFHLHGQALDITHPAGSGALHRAAAGVEFGGLGRYRSFVHVDTGPRRSW